VLNPDLKAKRILAVLLEASTLKNARGGEEDKKRNVLSKFDCAGICSARGGKKYRGPGERKT